MSVKIVISPAGSGKTAWAVLQARELSLKIEISPQVVVPTRLQAMIFRQRLADEGGAFGVHVRTFEDLAGLILGRAGIYPVRITEITQQRLLQDIVNNTHLIFYHGIKDTPGFIQVILDFIRELKAGGVHPDQILDAIDDSKKGPRIREIALIFSEYQKRLKESNWSDYVGNIWLAAELLEQNPDLNFEWTTIIFDGFDDLSPVQIRIIKALEKQISDLSFTLTGTADKTKRTLVHKRFNRTLNLLNGCTDTDISHLAQKITIDPINKPLRDLEKVLFSGENKPIEVKNAVKLAAVPDREAEVRTGLRWLKSLIIEKGYQPEKTAILTRNLEPYRLIVHRIANEFGMPLRIQGGLPLGGNPVIAAIIQLLRTVQPGVDYLNWRDVVEAWKSPYLDWQGLFSTQDSEDKTQDEANQLAIIARWGSVIQGYQQWKDAFAQLKDQSVIENNPYDEGPGIPDGIVLGPKVERLSDKFDYFVQALAPPSGENTIMDYISWIEEILGDENRSEGEDQTGLSVLMKIKDGAPELIRRDREAIRVLKGIFKDFVWSERALMGGPLTFSLFMDQLEQMIGITSYQPVEFEEEPVFCGNISETRGIPFQAVVILGLAEGEFPQTITEDPLLRESDRLNLQEEYGLPLRLSTESAEAEYFYEAVTRADTDLMLTRPRIADNGAPWKPSPYWEEILRCTNAKPVRLTSRSLPDISEAASRTEFFEVLSFGSTENDAWELVNKADPGISKQINLAQRVLLGRTSRGDGSGNIFNGSLRNLNPILEKRFPLDHVWSASRLETYQTCPYYFFVVNVLNLEKPDPPREGLDARQLGNIYHHILENLYQRVEKDSDLQRLQAALPKVAREVFKKAPRREGFRETGWWIHTQEEILTNLLQDLVVLESLDPSYKFFEAEQKFGIRKGKEPALEVYTKSGDRFFLRGFIDRVDRNKSGGLRIIDYKTSSPYGFSNQAVREGKKLQLPLYALAAQQALKLGTIEEGFYFHVRSAQTSPFKMSSFSVNGNKGPEAAINHTIEISWSAIQAIRQGNYEPIAPENGCPEYCPAADYCWNYKAQRW